MRARFGVRPNELPSVLTLFAWCFCVVGAIWLSRTVRDSLFLSRVSAAALPTMYIASPLVVTAFGFVYARLADRARRERLVVGSALLIAAVLVAARFALDAGSWFYYALYVAVDLMTGVAGMQFWTVAGDQFTARDAKRLIGLVAAGGTVANIVIGFGVSGLVKRAGAENLLFVCAALFAGTAALALLLGRISGGRLGRARPRAAGAARDERGLDAPGAGHLRVAAVIVVAAVVTLTLLDFTFKTIAAAAYHGDRVALVAFFGKLSGATGCVSLLIQLFVTARLLGRVGVAGVLLFLPISLACGATALVLLPGLAAATFTKAAEGTLRYTVNDAGMQLLYVPVPSGVKSRVKATIDAVVRPGTEALVGLALLVARGLAVALGAVAAVAVVSAAVWTAAVLRMRGAYLRSLRETLRRRRVELDGAAPVDVAALAAGAAGVEEAELARVVDDGPPARRRAAIHALGRLATADAAAALAARVGIADEGARTDVCRALAAVHRKNPAIAPPRRALRAAIDRELALAYAAIAAAEGLGRAETTLNADGTRAAPPFLPGEPDGAAALISKALRERWERAAARVLHLLEVLHPDERLAEVARSLGDRDPARRANAAEVLDAVVERPLRKSLVPLCDDTPRALKLAAAQGIVDVPRLTRDGWLRALLGDPSPWMAACAAYYAGNHELVGLRVDVQRLAAHPSPVAREAAQAAAARLALPERRPA